MLNLSISKQAALATLCNNCDCSEAVCAHYPCKQYLSIDNLPPAPITVYGYDIRHLELIASILRKENLPPERVAEALTDIGRIVSIIEDEFEAGLKRAFERCAEGQVQVFPNEDSNRQN